MNAFTKEIYKILGMDYKKEFIDQIENKANKSVFKKIDNLLKSIEYKKISTKLPTEDANGFIDYIYAFFEKRDDYIGAKVKERFNSGKNGMPKHIENDKKKLNDFKEYLNKVGRIKRNKDKIIKASLGFGCDTNANTKFLNMAIFIDEMLEDLNRKDNDYKIFTEYKFYKKRTIAKTIIDELETYNKFTKKELEKFSSKLNRINK